MSKDFYESLPKKRMGSGALFFNTKGELLVVKTTYKKNCEIPGGVVNDSESPREACEREVLEELGLIVKVRKLLVIDYQHATNEKTESLMFIFDGGVISDEQITQMKKQDIEIEELIFAKPEQAIELLKNPTATVHPVSRRVEQALSVLKTGIPVYLENRESVS